MFMLLSNILLSVRTAYRLESRHHMTMIYWEAKRHQSLIKVLFLGALQIYTKEEMMSEDGDLREIL